MYDTLSLALHHGDYLYILVFITSHSSTTIISPHNHCLSWQISISANFIITLFANFIPTLRQNSYYDSQIYFVATLSLHDTMLKVKMSFTYFRFFSTIVLQLYQFEVASISNMNYILKNHSCCQPWLGDNET